MVSYKALERISKMKKTADKCTHNWYFDTHEQGSGNYLEVDSKNDSRVYCFKCGKEWFVK